jgi:RNA polymerase sigma-70 factor (ECF subfamily)
MNDQSSAGGQFPTTHWTLIARLKSADGETARRALDELCAQYRFPLYCAIRRSGVAHHDAEDALHDFLAKLLRLNTFSEADAAKGRLRSLLGTALRRFLLNWHRDEARRKRDVKEDAFGADDERRYRTELFPDYETPEHLFDRQWARELLTRVLQRLGAQYTQQDKGRLFAALSPVLFRSGDLRDEDTAGLGAPLGLTAGALRVAYHRFLKDYRALLEGEVFQTVAAHEEVWEEISFLMASFRKA